jgi:hypothetical protein
MENNAIKSINSIRRRLLMTVVRAFAIVVVLTVISLLAITVYELNNKAKSNPFYKSPSTMLLEAYYIGNGSWSNIDRLVNSSQTPIGTPSQAPGQQPNTQQFPAQDWNESIVLDQNHIVLIDHGRTDTSRVGQIYTPVEGQPTTPIDVNGVTVGLVGT